MDSLSLLNEYQQVFTLSFLSNVGGNITNFKKANTSASIQDQLEAAFVTKINSALNTALPALGWSLAWGSSAYVDPLDIQSNGDGTYNGEVTNAAFVAKNGNHYVVSVSGTNFGSAFDAVVEDGYVARLISWPYGNPEGLSPRISNGTAIGISKLLNNMTDADGTSLQDFLASITDSGATITFAGHSLGGALAPALALALFNSESNVSSQLLQKRSDLNWTVNVYATAGPDVGNADYVTFLGQEFPVSDPGNNPAWQQYNRKIWNSLDVIPQVWGANIGNIDVIYSSNGLDTPQYVQCVVERAVAMIESFNLDKDPYALLDPDNKGQFPGTFLAPSQSNFSGTTINYDCDDCSATPDGVCPFLAEMLYQHIDMYCETIYGAQYNTLMKLLNLGQASACKVAESLYDLDILYCKTKP